MSGNLLLFLIGLTVIILLLFGINYAGIVHSYTYNDIWWIGGNDPNNAAGHLRMVYTYPPEVSTGSNFDVGITLEYLKDADQTSDWISFPLIIPVLKEINTNATYYFDIDTGNAASSLDEVETDSVSLDIVKQGEQFSKRAILTAPEANGTYMYGIIFDSYFGPGSGTDFHRWDVRDHYNATWRDRGIIYPDTDSPPIKITDARTVQNVTPLIRIELQEPYGRFSSSDIIVRSIANSISIQSSNETDKYVEFPVKSGSPYLLEVPEVMEMAENETRAIFLRWSDGITSNSRNVTVRDTQFSEYYAIYRPQYYLEVISDIGETQGSGWYDSQDQAQFSVNSLAGIWNLKIFDHWIGDISGESDIDIPSGFINMDGPKILEAVWVHDLTYLGIFSGIVVIAMTSVGTIRYFWIRRKSKSSAF